MTLKPFNKFCVWLQYNPDSATKRRPSGSPAHSERAARWLRAAAVGATSWHGHEED